MRIAVCLCGHMRFYKRIKPNFDKFYSKLSSMGSVDIFVATWDKQNTTGGTWSGNFNHLAEYHADIAIDSNEIKEFYGAKDIIVHNDALYSSVHSPLRTDIITESTERTPEIGPLSYNGVLHGYKQFFLVHQSNILKKKAEFLGNFKYDLVFRVRPDYFFRINYINKLDFNIKPNEVYTSPVGSSLDDQFYYGDSFTMDKVMSMYLRVACIVDNWNSESTDFNTLIFRWHPNIKGIRLDERVGVLPNDPMPERVEYGNDIHDVYNSIWYR